MNRLFLSDLHLADAEGRHFRAFSRLLAQQSRLVEEVYVLGDLCEVWIGDDDDGPLAGALVDVFKAACRYAKIFVMTGNRDFLLGHKFETMTGCRLLPDPFRLERGVLLSHGDAFCVDDDAYQSMRRLLRSETWQEDVLRRPLAERRALATAMRAESAATNANKADNIMDVSAAAISQVMQENEATVLIHGHTHRPGIHLHPWGRRYVLGAWERCAWAIRENAAGDLSLLCFPLTAPSAGRCET